MYYLPLVGQAVSELMLKLWTTTTDGQTNAGARVCYKLQVILLVSFLQRIQSLVWLAFSLFSFLTVVISLHPVLGLLIL